MISLPRRLAALLLAVAFCLPLPAWAAEITGRVVGLADGDTLTVLTAGRRQVRVRLGEIDTPESRQPYGTRARQVLSELVFSKDVCGVVQDTDRYGRTVGRVYAGQVDANAEMVRQGAAWVYRRYSRDAALLQMEAEAKAARRGLWALPEAEQTPPWEWRAAQRGGGSTGQVSPSPAPMTSAIDAGRVRRLLLWRQAVLPGDDELCRGALPPAAVRTIAAGWGWRRGLVRERA